MVKHYNQFTALRAIAKYSFKSILAHPASLIFGLIFPIIFILIFGSFSEEGGPSIKVSLNSSTDSTSNIYQYLKLNPILRFKHYTDTSQRNKDLAGGRLSAIISISDSEKDSLKPTLTIKTSTASEPDKPTLLHSIELMNYKYAKGAEGNKLFSINVETIKGRVYKRIDFILPGQIGFSILFATLFGIAFTFFNMREQLILKRFFATPVNKLYILSGIGLSRLVFQMLNVAILILFGCFFLGFTLSHGITTFVEINIITILILFLLMGVGLIISNIAKTDTAIPLLINIFGFPQMLLSGTFFPVSVFPKWLQDICFYLPLTQFNNAMRKICFDGVHLHNCLIELGILSGWTIVTYLIVSKVIRWEK